jgi:Domain of unknown function (DUF4407)
MGSNRRNIFLWLSAVDREVLAECPREATKFVAAGGAVLMTATMALAAATFTAHVLLHLSMGLSLLFGLAWGLAIMNLERYVQSSIVRQRSNFWTCVQALPRLGLAIALGLLISKPLLLQIFQPEIRAQVAIDHNAELAKARATLNKQFAAVAKLKKQASALETELHTPPQTGKALDNSPEYHVLAERYGIAERQAREASSPGQAESHARAAQETLEQMEPMREELLEAEKADNKRRKSDGEANLQTVDRQIAPLERELHAKERELAQRFGSRPGLADEDRALGALEHNNSSVAAEAGFLKIFIILVDVLPALIKVMMSMGRMSTYEEIKAAMDETTLVDTIERERLFAEEARRDSADHLRAQEQVRRARRVKQARAQTRMDDMSIDIIEKELRVHVERWSHAIASEYGNELAEEMARRAAARAHESEHARQQTRDPRHHGDDARGSAGWPKWSFKRRPT